MTSPFASPAAVASNFAFFRHHDVRQIRGVERVAHGVTGRRLILIVGVGADVALRGLLAVAVDVHVGLPKHRSRQAADGNGGCVSGIQREQAAEICVQDAVIARKARDRVARVCSGLAAALRVSTGRRRPELRNLQLRRVGRSRARVLSELELQAATRMGSAHAAVSPISEARRNAQIEADLRS